MSSNGKKNRRVSIPVRVLALVLALALAIPAMISFADQGNEDPSATQETIGLSGIEGNEENLEGNETEVVGKGYTVVAEDLVLALEAYKDIESINFLQGITVTDKDGKDVTESVTYQLPQGEDVIHFYYAGTHKVVYKIIENDVVVLEFARSLVLTENGISIHAVPLYISVVNPDDKNYVNGYDFLVLGSARALDTDGVDLSDYLTILDDGGFDPTAPGVYTPTIGVVKDGATLATIKREITVTFDRSTFARGGSMYLLGGSEVIGDELRVTVNKAGSLTIYRYGFAPDIANGGLQPTQTWVPYYFDSDNPSANTVSFRFDGVNYPAASFPQAEIKLVWTENGEDLGDTQTITRTYYIGGASNPKAQVVETISIVRGEPVIRRSFKMKNLTNATVSDNRILHGGDTYFGGYDNGFGTWSNVGGGTAMIFRDSQLGVMQLKGIAGSEVDAHYIGRYDKGSNLAMRVELDSTHPGGWNKQFPTTNPTEWNTTNTQSEFEAAPDFYIDQSYYIQWNKGTLAPGEEWEKESEETLADAGKLQLFSEGGKQAPAGVPVTHRFTMRNLDIVEGQTFNNIVLRGATSQNWPYMISPPSITSIAPGEDEYIYVTVWIPAKQPNGDEWIDGTVDVFTLSADYIDNTGAPLTVTANAKTRTIVNSQMAVITDVPITKQTYNNISIKVLYSDNVPVSSRPVEIKVTILDDDTYEEIATIPYIIRNMQSGDPIKDIDISSLIDGKKYIIKAEAVDKSVIPYANDTTTFVKGDEKQVPEGITLNPKTVEIGVGNSFDSYIVTLLPIAPPPTHDTTYKFFSSDSSVATVDPDTGRVTGIATGTVTITVQLVTDSSIKDTSTVKVTNYIEDIKTDRNAIVMRADGYEEVNVVIAPTTVDDKNLDANVRDDSIAIAYMDYGASGTTNLINQVLAVLGNSDGITHVDLTPRVITGGGGIGTAINTIKISVDGTDPVINGVTFEETTNNWRRTIVTGKELKVTVAAIDPIVNGFASGLDRLYYQVLAAASPAPTFDLNDTTGWTGLTTANPSFIMNSSTVPAGGNFKVYVVAVDKLDYYSDVHEAADDIQVDTSIPEIGMELGFDSDIHVLINTPITRDMIMTNVTATDDGVDISSLLTITPAPATITTNTVKKVTVTLSYRDSAGNTGTFDRDIYVHGKSAITPSKTSVNVNYDTGAITLVDHGTPANNFVNLNVPTVQYFNAAKALASINPSISASGNKVYLRGTAPNNYYILEVGEFARPAVGLPITTPVAYKASYTNPWSQIGVQDASANVNYVIYRNGDLPGAPDPNEPGPGIITPPNPTNPGAGVDPTPAVDDSTYRIRYYMNNGVLRSDNTTQTGLTASEIIAQVTATGATSTQVYIQSPAGTNVLLTEGSLTTALATLGQKKITYDFSNAAGHVYYYVFLEVNSDIRWTYVKALDTQIGRVINTNDLTGSNGHVAEFTNYRKSTVNLTITSPTAIDTATLRSYTVNYSANYPFVVKTASRVIRVHGNVVFTGADLNIRVNSTIPVGGVNATVGLAPTTVGNAATPKTVNVTMGLPIDTTLSGAKTQTYTGSLNLPAEYSSAYVITGSYDRNVSVHKYPEMSANNLLKGLGFTSAMLGNPVQNAEIDAKGWVDYVGQATTNIPKSGISVISNNIQYGVVGTYQIVFRVTDASVTRPTGLTAATTDYTMEVEITDAPIGQGGHFKGGNDVSWLVGKPRIEQFSIVAIDNNSGKEIPYTTKYYKEDGTTELTLAQVTAAPGIYKVTFTAGIPNTGQVMTKTNVIHVYGPISFLSTINSINYRVGMDTGVVIEQFKDSVSASYVDYENNVKIVTPSLNDDLFSLTDADLTEIGQKNGSITVRHPLFSDNTAVHNLKINVYSQIEIKGVDVLTNPVRRADGSSISTTTGVTSSYSGPDPLTGTHRIFTLPVVADQTSVSYSSTTAGKIANVKYTVEDDLFTTLTVETTGAFKFDALPSPVIYGVNVSIPASRYDNLNLLRTYYKPADVTYYTYNGKTYNVGRNDYFFDLDSIVTPSKGTYTIQVYYVDINGVESASIPAQLTIK